MHGFDTTIYVEVLKAHTSYERLAQFLQFTYILHRKKGKSFTCTKDFTAYHQNPSKGGN